MQGVFELIGPAPDRSPDPRLTEDEKREQQVRQQIQAASLQAQQILARWIDPTLPRLLGEVRGIKR